jgi:S1-C subfamily serine protease
MINKQILDRLRHAVCAVGYLRAPLPDYSKDAEVAGLFEVVGTGFLVRDEIVLTNRHVVDDLEREQRNHAIPDSQLFVMFYFLREADRLKQLRKTPRLIRAKYCLRDRNLDVAFLRFKKVNPDHFTEAQPVTIADPASVLVSETIAVLGYPHGRDLLEKDGRVSRYGPVLQQGWISGISPYERFGEPNEFLLDLRVAHGISGAPVFQPETGAVCGVLHSGTAPTSERGEALTTTAFAQPISGSLLAGWISEFERNEESDEDQ